MMITRIGSQPSAKGPADWFTGVVRIDPLFGAKEPARAGGASVTFEPGARTAWHTHPLGVPPAIPLSIPSDGGPVRPELIPRLKMLFCSEWHRVREFSPDEKIWTPKRPGF